MLCAMGCTSSSVSKRVCSVGRKKKLSIREVVVFVPTMLVPAECDFLRVLKGLVPRELIDKMSSIRSQMVLAAEDTAGSDLNRALEQYLPLVLGLTKKEYALEDKVKFEWKDLQDPLQEICISNAWSELLSVMHMMAILSLAEANSLLVPKNPLDASERTVSEDCKKDAIDLLLKAAGYLEFCIHHILVHIPPDIQKKLPLSLQEGVLEAISIQALGQGTEMQLGLAVEIKKVSLPVKRRLACERLSYYAQAHYCLSGCDMTHEGGAKHLLFIKWKYLEAKASAHYYHGQILDKGKEPSCHIKALCSFLAADELLTDSKRACLSFCLASPVSRTPPIWGVMKHLHRKIPETASRKFQMYGHLLEQEKSLQPLPDLPEFPLSLRPDEYKLPEMDPVWEIQIPAGRKEQLKDGEDEMN